MLRVGLTGELGSGKSTVARMLTAHGAVVLSSDEMGRAMMQPGHQVFTQIVEHFGTAILNADGTLDRHALAHVAFDPQKPRIEELNTIIHPAVIAAQAETVAEIAHTQPHAIVVVESALIFSTKYTPEGSWRSRFDCIVLVTAPEEAKVARFIARASENRTLSNEARLALETDARRRLAQQTIPSEATVPYLTLHNGGELAELERQVDTLWQRLCDLERQQQQPRPA